MKKILLLVTSSLVIASSGASAQGNSDACHNQYGACVERCSTRPASLIEKCSQSCEMSTNQCYSTMYGQPSQARNVAPAAAASAQENEATEARDEAQPEEPKPAAKAKKKKK